MAKSSGKNIKKVPAWKKRQIKQQHSIERRAALTTGILFLALFISFIFIALKAPVDQITGEGNNVIVGEDNFGATEQLKELNKASEKQKQEQQEAAKKQEEEKNTEAPDDKPSQKENIEGDVPVNQKDKEKAEEKPEAEEQEKDKQQEEEKQKAKAEAEKEKQEKAEKKQEVDTSALFEASSNQGDEGKEGNKGKESGDKTGDKAGDPGDKKADGPYDARLGSRSLTNDLKIKNDCNKNGKVVVEITVNREGEVIKAVPGAKGTTAIDQCLMKLAKKHAKRAKFTPAPNGALREVGTITFNFKYQ